MFGLPTGVPLAEYGPRGSDQAVANIRSAAAPGVPAVLLANHGLLVFHRTPDLAIMVNGVIEEAAQAGITASQIALIAPRRSPPLPRRPLRMAFDTPRTQHAWGAAPTRQIKVQTNEGGSPRLARRRGGPPSRRSREGAKAEVKAGQPLPLAIWPR